MGKQKRKWEPQSILAEKQRIMRGPRMTKRWKQNKRLRQRTWLELAKKAATTTAASAVGAVIGIVRHQNKPYD